MLFQFFFYKRDTICKAHSVNQYPEVDICHLALVFLRLKNTAVDNELLSIFWRDVLDGELGANCQFSDGALKLFIYTISDHFPDCTFALYFLREEVDVCFYILRK